MSRQSAAYLLQVEPRSPQLSLYASKLNSWYALIMHNDIQFCVSAGLCCTQPGGMSLGGMER